MFYLLENTSPPVFVTDMVLHRSSIFIKTIISSGCFNNLCSCVCVRSSWRCAALCKSTIMAVLELAKQILINYPAMTHIA